MRMGCCSARTDMVRRSFTICSLAAALVVGAFGCDGTPAITVDPANRGSAAAPATGTVNVADIVGNPDAYLGRTVTVQADVEEVLGPMAFALDEDSPLTGGVDNDLLVFSRKSASLANIDDQWLNNRVRVTGTVSRMSVVELEREIGWDLDPRIEAELERVRPVLIAQSVERTQP